MISLNLHMTNPVARQKERVFQGHHQQKLMERNKCCLYGMWALNFALVHTLPQSVCLVYVRYLTFLMIYMCHL
jgi:hypothetical protein